MKLTEWFPAGIKPFHIGEYEVKSAHSDYANFRVLWDGSCFRFTSDNTALGNQHREWRGILK